MKTNKEIKVGDKIWPYDSWVGENSFFTVKSVRKVKTLVEVVATVSVFDKEREYVMYGHCSSAILSGYNRYVGRATECYTCEYALVSEIKNARLREERYVDAGRALLCLAKYLK